MKTITITFRRGGSRVTVTGQFRRNLDMSPITWSGAVAEMSETYGTRLPDRHDGQSMQFWVPWAKRHGWDATMTESGDWIMIDVADVE